MTHDHPQPDRDALIERFRRLRLRVTPQRLLIVEALATNCGHMTADEVLRWAAERYPAINLATVYRTLDLLASVGLVTQTDLGGGATQFELVGDSVHHHLVCERCGAVSELDDSLLAPMRERLLLELGFRASSRHMAIFGTCAACLAAGRGQPSPAVPVVDPAPVAGT
jgi:Fur family ferric uptake transcriptional regulator